MAMEEKGRGHGLPEQLGVMLGWYPGQGRGMPGVRPPTAGTGGPGARREERRS